MSSFGRVVVRDARERALDARELRGVALERLELARAPIEHARDDLDDEPFGELDDIVERRVGDFGFDHPELGEVPARLRLLGAERRPEAVHAAERHRVGLVVELAALREVRRRVVEVLHGKERRRAFARRRREDRRVGEDEAAAVEVVAHRVDHLVAHAQDRLLARRADPQVAPIHQEVDAVFLRRDREVVRLAHDLEARDVDLVAARRALVRARGAVHDDGALLREVVGPRERLVADGGLGHDGLDEAGSVADLQKVDLAARSAVASQPLIVTGWPSCCAMSSM